MRKQNKSMLVLAIFMAFIAIGLFFAGMTRTVHADPRCRLLDVCEKLDAIDAKLEPLPCEGAPVAKTGQAQWYADGDDGDLEKGVAWPDPRFTDQGDGTVTDNLTGLMWTKDANMYGQRDWTNALSDCASCTAGGYSDWRLPNVRELHSLIDYGRDCPALPAGHPFFNVQSSYYWSSSTYANRSDCAWRMDLHLGYVGSNYKYVNYYVLCVRGGQ